MSKKVTLKGGKNATLIDMSVDTFDECMDAVEMEQKGDDVVIKNQFSLSTKWIRNGCKEGKNDKFIKSLTIAERTELQIAIQEYNGLGE
mgnify:CR=1 FL=1